jgi:hypothetical protein
MERIGSEHSGTTAQVAWRIRGKSRIPSVREIGIRVKIVTRDLPIIKLEC